MYKSNLLPFATIYLSYLKIKNNLDSILQDVNRMPLKHVSKQSDINQKEFFNERNQIYGSIFSIKGNAASQIQFYLTDKTKNFLTGSLYFYSKPNYDSLLPAIRYIENDIKHFMNFLQLKLNYENLSYHIKKISETKFSVKNYLME